MGKLKVRPFGYPSGQGLKVSAARQQLSAKDRTSGLSLWPSNVWIDKRPALDRGAGLFVCERREEGDRGDQKVIQVIETSLIIDHPDHPDHLSALLGSLLINYQ